MHPAQRANLAALSSGAHPNCPHTLPRHRALPDQPKPPALQHHAAAGGSRADNTVAAARQDKRRNTARSFYPNWLSSTSGTPCTAAAVRAHGKSSLRRSSSVRARALKSSRSSTLQDQLPQPGPNEGAPEQQHFRRRQSAHDRRRHESGRPGRRASEETLSAYLGMLGWHGLSGPLRSRV
jgi:hypothetical protein